MNKAVFLDRDGTINIEKNYLYKVQDFEFIPGVVEALRMLQESGYMLIVITNQSGIGRGYYSENDFFKLTEWMVNELGKSSVYITDVFFCPHLPNARIEKYRKVCNCRKPSIGLYEKAVKKYNIDLASSFAIGDKIRDCSICETSLCHGFLLGENESIEIIEDVKLGKYKRVSYASDMLECAKIMISDTRRKL